MIHLIPIVHVIPRPSAITAYLVSRCLGSSANVTYLFCVGSFISLCHKYSYFRIGSFLGHRLIQYLVFSLFRSSAIALYCTYFCVVSFIGHSHIQYLVLRGFVHRSSPYTVPSFSLFRSSAIALLYLFLRWFVNRPLS